METQLINVEIDEKIRWTEWKSVVTEKKMLSEKVDKLDEFRFHWIRWVSVVMKQRFLDTSASYQDQKLNLLLCP
eukprot:m.44100 g.44100  ORF g.44100 m.44100 type:complete len:74 (+) comp10048_c0_seq5:646-867(+)